MSPRRRDFAGRTVLVTGAGRGLGRALCRVFGTAGARIGGLDLSRQALEETATELRAAGIEHAVAAADVSDETAVRDAYAQLAAELGPVDALINNAGITHLRNFRGDDCDAVRRVMEVNFQGSVHCTAAALADLRARRGLIIAISSVAGYAPLTGRAAYCASKHALHGFFDTLRIELAADGVDVLIVCPSYIATGIRSHVAAASEDDDRARVIGGEDSPLAVAEQILRSAHRGRRQITTGRVGWAAYWLHRLSPRAYERLMRRRIRDEP